MRKKIGRKIILFVAIVTAGQVLTFSHYNGILTQKTAKVTQPANPPKTTTAVQTGLKLHDLSLQYQPLSLSNNGEYVAYIEQKDILHIKVLATGKELTNVQLKAPVTYLRWIRSDSVFIGENFTVSNMHMLTLGTVDVASGTVRRIKTFTGYGPSVGFMKISYSPFSNDVYVLLGDSKASFLYHFNTNGDMNEMSLGGRYVSNVSVSQTNNDLFFQDFRQGTKNVLEDKNHNISLIHLNAVILRTLGNDLYYGLLNNSGLITSVYKFSGGTSTLVTNLATPATQGQISVDSNGKVVQGPSYQ